MESLESALCLLLEKTVPVEDTETVNLIDALGRVAAQDIASPMNIPPFDRSPLDGYALHSGDIANASVDHPVYLRVIGEACAGCETIFHPGPGEALRIMTGAPVPSECDCIIRQEDTDEGMETAAFYAAVKSGSNICREGEDVTRGEVVIRAGEQLTSAHIGVLSSFGVCNVTVFRRVKASLLCTGDEVTTPGQPLPFGKIYDANGAALTARLIELGITPAVMEPERDEPEQVAMMLEKTLEHTDIVITTGGVSVGKKDIFHKVLPLMDAERLFWKISMKPGSPMMAACKNGKLIICLSGNPFAALACFEIFAVPVLKKLSGITRTEHHRIHASLSGAFGKKSPGRRLIRAYFDGEKVCIHGDNHSSGSLSTMIGCNCLIDIPAGTGPLSDGDEVEAILL